MADKKRKELVNAIEEGLAGLRTGSALDGAERAVRYMEESGAFNSGRGACLTSRGEVELDAAVMTGRGRAGAGVGSVTCTYHPVSLARWISENTKHILIVGDECSNYAKSAGMRVHRVKPSKNSSEKYMSLVKEKGKVSPTQDGNTVGAVAMGRDGVPAAAVSTGGMWLKLPGRVGDSAILGAGIYADMSSGAACATGVGEEIIKSALSIKACEHMRTKSSQVAAGLAIRHLTRLSGSGTAGIITVDMKGRVGASFNTEAMPRAWHDSNSGKTMVRT